MPKNINELTCLAELIALNNDNNEDYFNKKVIIRKRYRYVPAVLNYPLSLTGFFHLPHVH